MPSMAELKDQARGLTVKLAEITENAEMTVDEKKTALDAINEDVKSVSGQIANSETASNMAAKLDGFGDIKDEKGVSLPKFEMPSPFTNETRKSLAYEALSQEGMEDVFAAKEGFRKKYDLGWELGTKDATEAGNLIGEGLYGSSTPTGVGQNPFLAGAFGPGILPDFRPGIVEKLFYELTLADLITSFSTNAPNISYLTESLANLQANQVAEAGAYPFSSVEVSRVYAQIGKIANAMTISDEAIADAPTLFNFVQGRLLFSLQRQEEVQVLAASGYPGVGGLLSFAGSFAASSAGSIYGATSATGTNVAFPPAGTNGAGVVAQTVASLAYGRVVTGATGVYPTPQVVALNLKDAFVDIELSVFKTPTAVVMHPRDWQRLETAEDANGQFMNTSYFGNVYGVKNSPVKSIWGVPVVTSPMIPVGTILTGWFDPQSVQIARRQGVSMQMTNSNGTDFVNGKVTVRAEERLGLLCYRPTAFQLIQLVAG